MAKSLNINDSILEIITGNIVNEHTSAIVNAANAGLRGGGGVDGAIHRAGGPQIMAECRKIGRCPTGTAVVTTAGNLAADYVIHTVGPIWRGGKNKEEELLRSCYNSSLALAAEKNLDSVSFPSISTGVYSFPLDKAAPIALTACRDFMLGNPVPKLVRFVLFDQSTYAAYDNAMDGLQ